MGLLKFFVSSDTSVVNDRLWHDKYKLRTGQIPTFINEEQANKVSISPLINVIVEFSSLNGFLNRF